MADFLKDNSVVTIFLDDDNPGDGNAIAKAQEPTSLDDAVVLAGVADKSASIGVDEVDVDASEVEIPASEVVTPKAESVDTAAELEFLREESDDAIAIIGQNRVSVVNPRKAPRVNPVNPSADLDKYVMHQNSVRSSNTLGFGLVLLMLAVALIVVLWVGFGFIADQAKEQGAQTLRDSIMDSAMQCFAIEGYYPPSLEYLQENYGLSVNEDDYLVIYEAFASNVPPTVDVRLR